MEIDITSIVTIIFGAGGIVMFLVKSLVERKKKKDEISIKEVDSLKKEIKNLNDKIENLSEERLQLSIKAARLEERILVHAKNKVKSRIDLDNLD